MGFHYRWQHIEIKERYQATRGNDIPEKLSKSLKVWILVSTFLSQVIALLLPNLSFKSK